MFLSQGPQNSINIWVKPKNPQIFFKRYVLHILNFGMTVPIAAEMPLEALIRGAWLEIEIHMDFMFFNPLKKSFLLKILGRETV